MREDLVSALSRRRNTLPPAPGRQWRAILLARISLFFLRQSQNGRAQACRARKLYR
jgi:hypothetical protein